MPLPDIDALWDYHAPAETEVKFRAVLPEAQASGDVNYHAELLTQIARTLSLRRQFDDAHTLLDQVETMLTPDTSQARVRYLLERGRTYNSSKQIDKARPLFMEAWELGARIQADFYAVDALHMLAIVDSGETALQWNLKAVEYANASPQARPKKWLGSLYNNIGWAYHDMGDFESALTIFQKADAWQSEHGTAQNQRIAQWCIGRTLRSLGRPEEALVIHQAQLKTYEALDQPATYTYEELAECLLALGHDTEATPYFAQAYTELSKDEWFVENEGERLARIKRLGGK